MIAIVAALPGVVASIMGVLNNIIAHRNTEHMAETKSMMKTLEANTNGKMDELLNVTKTSEFARGVKQGEDNQK